MTFVVGKLRASELNDLLNQNSPLPLGVLARAQRTTASSGSTGTEVGVLRLDDVPIYAGRLYRIFTGNLNIDTSVADDIAHCRLRITTDGSTPSTSSTQLGGGMRDDMASASAGPIIAITHLYAPSADETLSVLLTVNRIAGTGTIVIYGDATTTIDLAIEDVGLDPGDTGVDI